MHIDQHRHPRRHVPHHVAVEQPYAGVISPEPEHRVPVSGDLNRIPERCVAKVEWLGWIDALWGYLLLQARGDSIRERIVRLVVCPGPDGGLVDSQHVEMVAVLYTLARIS